MKIKIIRKLLIMDKLINKEEEVWKEETTNTRMEGRNQEDLTKNSEDLVNMIEVLEVPAIEGVPEDNLKGNIGPIPTKDNIGSNHALNRGTNLNLKRGTNLKTA